MSETSRPSTEPGRSQVSDSTASPARPPHVTENDRNATVGPNGGANSQSGPSQPANASGTDRVGVAEQSQPIEPESMYDGRPSQDKDHGSRETGLSRQRP
jgi:hypothetical protein